MGILDFLRREVSRDAFAKRVIARLRERGCVEPIEYRRDDFVLRFDDGDIHYLGRLYPDWLDYPLGQRGAQLDNVAASIMGPRTLDALELDYESAAPTLRPLVRNRMHTVNLRLGDGHTGQALAGGARPLAEHLCILAAVDLPSNIALVSDRMLHGWGRSFDEVIKRAMENLRAESIGAFERQDDGFYLSRWDDHYDASRLLLPDLFRALPFQGAPVAVVLSRRCIAVADSVDAPALNAMATFVREALPDETRAIAYAPLVLQGDIWAPFEPADPDLAAIRWLNAKQRVWDYLEQGLALKDGARAEGQDLFAVPLEMIESDGHFPTWTSWTENTPCLLPKADYVALTTAAGAGIMRRWLDVEAACGPFLPEPDQYPMRFSPPAWPDAKTWERLVAQDAPSWFDDPIGPLPL